VLRAIGPEIAKHPLLDPAEEEKIIAFFGARGAKARVDYLADKGRTRILEFPLPADAASIARICGDLLTGVYAMRADDLLRYTWHAASKR
jgi:hypothetical protein